MSKGLNKIHLIGNVGRDPETTTKGDLNICKISLATGRYKGDESDWHRITFFGKLADVAQAYVRKGAKIYVEGRVQYTQTEKDGVKVTYTDVIASELQLLERRADTEAPRPSVADLAQPNDDLPF
jgi:single-strand DNA-binding protein